MTIKLSSTNCVIKKVKKNIVFFFNDAMIAVFCSKSERFNESLAKWFHNPGSSKYIFLDDLPSQTGVYLNNGRR